MPTPLPGTTADRINLPTNFRDTFKQMEVFDNNQNRQIRVIWANDIAQSVDTTQPWNFPYGSIMVFESYATVNDDSGNPTLDANGRFDLETAVAYAQALAAYGLRWYEEPGDPLDYQLQAKLGNQAADRKSASKTNKASAGKPGDEGGRS